MSEAVPHLVGAERQHESLAGRWREALAALGEAAGFLFHVLHVEHVVQAAVFVADHVEHQVVVVLVGVDVVEDHQGVAIETGLNRPARLSVDDVKQRLGKKETFFCVVTKTIEENRTLRNATGDSCLRVNAH